jgi:AraC-like DNA-binding protein
MKALPFKIPKTDTASIRVQVDHQPYFYDTLHQHPETQITLIVSGTGTLFQGQHIGDFQPGDVFVIGANVPHVLKSDAQYYESKERSSHAISIFFDESSLGDSFFELPELKEVKQLLHQSIRGIQLSGSSREATEQQILAMTKQDGLNAITSLLCILNTLTQTEDFQYLTEGFSPYLIDETEGLRLNEIFQFTLKEYDRPIKLEEVASISNMTTSAFCRYFKQRTRKTYVTFLNEVRIAQSCKLLISKDFTIAQICYQCGFNNLSHFNRVFKHINNLSPKAYRKSRVKYA